MSALLPSTHKGNTYEILGDFLLTLLGSANPQRRQFDHGYDFYCNISTEIEGLLAFDSPFTIQIKSGDSLQIQYGKQYNKWKQVDITWLYNHQIPFFLGFINVKEKSLSIYDTSGIWFLYGLEYYNCSQILFKPNNRAFGIRRELPKKTKIKKWGENKGDGVRYEIDLGNPVITVSVDDIENPILLQQKKDVLRQIVNIESENITNRNLGIFCFKEIKQNTTNELSNVEWGLQILGNYNQAYILRIYESISFALISLISNLKFHEREAEYQAIKNVLRLMPEKEIYKDLYKQNPELFDWVNTKT
jgi:Domain of unknown function (DUF4365)